VTERLHVLVVDDEAPARDELAFLLQQQELVGRVAQATGATGCLELLARGGFDAVFLDVRMPHLDGLELSRLIAQMARPPQVVFVTAYEDHAVEAFGLAAVDYLLKPVRPERLGVTLGRLTRARARAAADAAPASASPLGDRIAVSARGRIRLLPAAEVLVAIADGEGVTVRTVDGPLPTSARRCTSWRSGWSGTASCASTAPIWSTSTTCPGSTASSTARTCSSWPGCPT